MKYTIEWLEKKKEGESNGRHWAIHTMSLKDEKGDTIVDVDTFDSVALGQEIEGTIQLDEKYKTKKFVKALEKPNFMQKKMEVIMEKKQSNISQSMDRKEESIKLAGAQRDATLIVINFYKDLGEADIKGRLEYWYDYFLNKLNAPPF